MRRVLIFLVVLLLSITNIYANSAPVYMPSSPSFEIVLLEDCPLEVEREKLTFDIDKSYGRNQWSGASVANVNAEYIIYNPTDETVKACMAFPFVTTLYNDDIKDTKIKLGNEPIPYDIRLGNEIELNRYSDDELNIDNIIASMNIEHYNAVNIDDEKKAWLYTIDAEYMSEPYYIDVSFNMDSEKTNIIEYGFNGWGYEQSENADVCTLQCSRYEKGNADKLSFLVIGDKKIDGIRMSAYKDYEKKETVPAKLNYVAEEIRLRDFIIEGIINPSHVNELFAIEQIYDIVLEYLDNNMANHNAVISEFDLETLLETNNYIASYLYEIIVHPDEKVTMTVNYDLSPSMDRSESKFSKNIYTYIINPAQGFAKFGGIDIKISPDEINPYVLDSTIELERQKNGEYIASFDYLPQTDLEFSTYVKSSISPLEKIQAKYLRGWVYVFYFAIIIIGPVVLFVLIYKIVKYYIKKRHNLL